VIITVGSVALELILGMVIALVMHRTIFGRGTVRSSVLIPYGIVTVVAAFAWRYAWAADSGFVPGLLGLDYDPLTRSFSSYVIIILTEVWKTTPFMALLLLAGLSQVSDELHEAARVDGASAWQRFRTITFPLLLVALAPLLIASFAYNFNNFAAIFLVSGGAPFSPDNPSAGGTDILITYTYRLAFGGSGAQYGFAAAVSVFIFLIVAVFSIISFRRTHALEEIN
jgi:arabinogalactan oligomer/maltooligosaccharide transport system permease protein